MVLENRFMEANAADSGVGLSKRRREHVGEVSGKVDRRNVRREYPETGGQQQGVFLSRGRWLCQPEVWSILLFAGSGCCVLPHLLD